MSFDPIGEKERIVANVRNGKYQPFISSDGTHDGDVLQVNGGRVGYGFHVYRMAPGQNTIPHTHTGDEEFFVIEGDIQDHDGYEYKPGDLVCLKSGTHHTSYSKNGCLLVVMFRDAEGN